MGDGARVTIYAGASLCRAVRKEVERRGGRAGGVRVRVACLPADETGGRLDLAAVGAGARRTTEDSTAVAYVRAPSRAIAYARPIVEEAEIGILVERSGRRAADSVLDALASRGDELPREAVASS